MLLQNKAGRSLSQGSPLRRNETGKMKTKKSTNYDQYFGLSKRMRFSAKLGNLTRNMIRKLQPFQTTSFCVLFKLSMKIGRWI